MKRVVLNDSCQVIFTIENHKFGAYPSHLPMLAEPLCPLLAMQIFMYKTWSSLEDEGVPFGVEDTYSFNKQGFISNFTVRFWFQTLQCFDIFQAGSLPDIFAGELNSTDVKNSLLFRVWHAEHVFLPTKCIYKMISWVIQIFKLHVNFFYWSLK